MKRNLWVNGTIKQNYPGHIEFEGMSGNRRFIIELDRDALVHVPRSDRVEYARSILPAVLKAASRRKRMGDAYPRYKSFSDKFDHHRIAVTSTDISNNR